MLEQLLEVKLELLYAMLDYIGVVGDGANSG